MRTQLIQSGNFLRSVCGVRVCVCKWKIKVYLRIAENPHRHFRHKVNVERKRRIIN